MIAQPQIALVGERSWAIIGPCFTITGLLSHWPLPQVDCPLVDTCLLDEEQVQRILRSYVKNPLGVDDPDALIEALLQCGARLISPLSNTAYPVDLTSVEQPAFK